MKACKTCGRNNNGEKALLWKFIILGVTLSLGSLAFVSAGINEDLERLDERFERLDITLQREIILSDSTLQSDIESLQKQIDSGFATQVNSVDLMTKRIGINDDWIRNHIENHP